MADLSPDDPVTKIKGIGPSRSNALYGTHRISTVEDLIRLYPRDYMSVNLVQSVKQIDPESEEKYSIPGRIKSVGMSSGGSSQRLEVILADPNGDRFKAVFFRGASKLGYALDDVEEALWTGEFGKYGKWLSTSHPDWMAGEDGTNVRDGLYPIYSMSDVLDQSNVSQKVMRGFIYQALDNADLPEVLMPIPSEIEDEHDLIDGEQALIDIHFPDSQDDLDAAMHRIKFEELFYLQLLLTILNRQRQTGPVFEEVSDGLRTDFLSGLPFSLTGAQKRSLEEILSDMKTGEQMNRLLQGDVGAGKTVVAVASMLQAIDNGYQAAFMAPTQVLAQQHKKTLDEHFSMIGIEPILLDGSQTKNQQDVRKQAISSGDAEVVVGTHAVIQEDVEFDNLGLAVVDEQQRFGVEHRESMFDKAESPHMLLMTATPIPRSLAMTRYGDLDVSVLDEMPPGRKEVETIWYPSPSQSKMKGILDFVHGQIGSGHQVFWVCPMIQPSPNVDQVAATSTHQWLENYFSDFNVDLVHGDVKDNEKDRRMDKFAAGETDILVSTTVVEVGVDVPGATVMVIDDANQFGLSQLHQLRGRVGRNDVQSYCLLVTRSGISKNAEERMEAMTITNDGFEISEIDLEIRGTGDFAGTDQSGALHVGLASVEEDKDLLETADEAAVSFTNDNPQLNSFPEVEEELKSRFPNRSFELARIG